MSKEKNNFKLSWIDSLSVRIYEWCEYDGYCNLKVEKELCDKTLRGSKRIADILREVGVTEEQARKWHSHTERTEDLKACCGKLPILTRATEQNAYPNSYRYECKICGKKTIDCFSADPSQYTEKIAREAWNENI